jgi:F-type H+-transporting ATPase subunit epsilon
MPVALEIVSPEKLLLSRNVEMVVIPASEGDMGVLPNHSPMIVLLRGGTISITEGGRVTDTLFVSGGFAEITPERCTVLADEAVPTGELSRAEGERRLQVAEAEYSAADKMDVPALDAAMDRMQAARAMIAAAAA